MFTLFDKKLHETAAYVYGINREYFQSGWEGSRLNDYTLAGLRETLRYVKQRSPFYQRHLAGVSEDQIASLNLESFAQIPFTTKGNLRESLWEMLSKPLSECCFYYETTGTTGIPTPCPRDYVDSIYSNYAVTMCLETILKENGERQFVGLCGPTELHSFGDTLGDVCRNMGLAMAKLWPYSPVIGVKKAIESLASLGFTTLVCTPGLALTFAKSATSLGYDLKKDFHLKNLLLTGEVCSPAMVANLASLWNARAYNFLYGSQEALVLATAARNKKMHTFPLNYHYEVIDPVTLRALPYRDGRAEGELVVTMLFQGSKPMVRYRTGDYVRLTQSGSEDIFSSPTLEVLGRVADSMFLNGNSLSASEIEDAVLQGIGDCLGYQLLISQQSGIDHVAIEMELLSKEQGSPRIKASVEQRFLTHWKTPCELKFGPIGSIGSTGALVSWKAARIIDKRKAGHDPEKEAALAIAKVRESSLST